MARSAFINVVTAIIRRVEADSGMDQLSARSRFLLGLIGEFEVSANPVSPSELIKAASVGTPPTIYASIIELENGEWITRRLEKSDRRIVRLSLSPKAKRAFDRMSREILRATDTET